MWYFKGRRKKYKSPYTGKEVDAAVKKAEDTTATAEEINAAADYVDDLTATAAEVNAAADYVDDLTATAAEVNSAITFVNNLPADSAETITKATICETADVITRILDGVLVNQNVIYALANYDENGIRKGIVRLPQYLIVSPTQAQVVEIMTTGETTISYQNNENKNLAINLGTYYGSGTGDNINDKIMFVFDASHSFVLRNMSMDSYGRMIYGTMAVFTDLTSITDGIYQITATVHTENDSVVVEMNMILPIT